MNAVVEAAKSCYAVEWSQDQHCFHIDPLGSAIENNQDTTVDGRNPGFVIIGLFGTYDEASDFCDVLRVKFPAVFAHPSAAENSEDESE